ncbi:MAG: hypothetical protein AAF810_26590 [Cyanobacteria bacterium P01_D01_bin.36]
MAAPNEVVSKLEAIDVRLENITNSLNRTTETLEANTEQIARFMEGLTRLENIIERGFERTKHNFNSLETLMRQQHETTQMQARHIDRLMSITETLIQQRVA